MNKNKSNTEEVFQLLHDYIFMFPTNSLTPKGLRMYAERLTQYPLAKIKETMERLVVSSKYFPTLAEIIGDIKANWREPVYGSKAWIEQERKQQRQLESLKKKGLLYCNDNYTSKQTSRM